MALTHSRPFMLSDLLLLSACGTVQHLSNAEAKYTVVSSANEPDNDAGVTAMIAPYKESIDEAMNEVLGTVAVEMTKKKPESTLGNWYCDAMLFGARKAGFEVDFAISNYGGLRVPYLSPGPLTRGEIFELSPFDNLLVIVDIPGATLDSVMQQIAGADGWPVSTGVKMVIRDKKAVSTEINNKPIDIHATYHVAMPDYVANGGDDFKILIPLFRTQTSLLQRDIIMDYAQEATRNGHEIKAEVEGRITIVK